MPHIDRIFTGIEANQSLDFRPFLRTLDRSQELNGIRVVFFDGFTMHVIRRGPPLCGRDVRAVVVKPDIGESTLRDAELAAARESKVYTELINTGLGCGGAIMSWVVAGGAAGTVPLTGGTSLIVEKFALPAAVTGTIACGNSIYRLYNEVKIPERNDWLDNQWWYSSAVAAMDAVGLVGVGISASATVKLALHMKHTTTRTMLEILKSMSRQQRKMLAEEVVRIQNPGISNTALKAFVRAGAFPKRYTPYQVTHTIRNQLRDAYGAMAGFIGSAYDGLVNKGVQALTDDPPKPKKPTVYGNYVMGIANSFDTF